MNATTAAHRDASGMHESTLIGRGIVYWLCAGLVGVLLLPAARAHSADFGWTAYWLVGAPLLMLLAQHRHALTLYVRRNLVSWGGQGSTDVAGARSPFERRQGWRHIRPRVQARRLGVR